MAAPASRSSADPAPAPGDEEVAIFEDVWKRFDRPVLQGASLEAPPGQVTVVLGGSGSGKTTLVRVLLGLESYDRGSVRLFGREVRELGGRAHGELMRRVGMLFQFGALFDSLSVADNVGFALRYAQGRPRGEIEQVVREKLDLVGLDGVSHLYPAQLSGGMRKRVALARAIAHQPELLCMDEPTSGLDPMSADTINDLILEMRERLGATVLCITHDIEAAFRIADRIAILYEGRVRTCAPPDAIRASDDEVVRQFVAGRAPGPRS